VKVRTQVGDKTVDFEYSSRGIKANEVKELVSILSASMQEKPVETADAPQVEISGSEKLADQPETDQQEGVPQKIQEGIQVVDDTTEDIPNAQDLAEKLEDTTVDKEENS
jgi:hypothetical protein